MQEFIVSLILAISAYFVYKWSYKVLWYKVGYLFDQIHSNTVNTQLSLQKGLHNNANIYNKDTFIHKFYAEYSISSHKIMKFVRILFATAMVCYVVTIEIVLWQIRAADSEREGGFITKYIWPLMALLLSLILILIQPFLILISLLNKFFNDKLDIDRLIIITTAAVGACITILAIVNFGPFSYSNNILTRLSVTGVTLMGILSGIACASTVYYTSLFFWYKFRGRSSSVVKPSTNNFQKDNFLLWSSSDLLKRKSLEYEYEISRLRQLINGQTSDQNQSLGNKPGGYIEILGNYQMGLNRVQDALDQSSNIRIARKMFGSIFLIYCVHKISFTFLFKLPRIIYHHVNFPNDVQFEFFESKSDPLAVTFANILDFMLFHFNYQHDLESLTSQISLLLSASLFICSFSAVNTTISFLFSLLPIKFQMVANFAIENSEQIDELPTYENDKPSHGKASMIKNLLVSELSGIYVIATVLMIRSNLPYNVSIKLRDLLGEKFTVPNTSIDCWFDEIFALSCIMTFSFIKFAERRLPTVNTQNKEHL